MDIMKIMSVYNKIMFDTATTNAHFMVKFMLYYNGTFCEKKILKLFNQLNHLGSGIHYF